MYVFRVQSNPYTCDYVHLQEDAVTAMEGLHVGDKSENQQRIEQHRDTFVQQLGYSMETFNGVVQELKQQGSMYNLFVFIYWSQKQFGMQLL